MASIEPYNRLVKYAARAFYDDITKGETQTKAGRSDNRGIAVVILDALTRRQWVREEDLAKDLKLHTKQLRRTLKFFEEEKLVTLDNRKEASKGAKENNAAVGATGDGQKYRREGDDKQKVQIQSYCCLDYSQIYDVVRYRIQRMKKKLKDELDSKNTVQVYICPNCNKRYTALDALRLISMYDEYFHCESCNGVLVAESDKLAAQEMGDGDDASRRRHDKLKDMLRKMDEQLKPLTDQLTRVKDLPAPEFGSLQAWELRVNAAGRGANGDNSNDPSRSMGTSMPYVVDTNVEVAFSGADDKGDVKPASDGKKVLPPWMIMQGMNLTSEQRGETNQESKMDGTITASELSDDKKSTVVDDDTKNFQGEYVKAYYAALILRQREQEEMVKKEQDSTSIGIPDNTPSERQVGMKSKRDDEDDGDDNEWEEAPPTGSTSEQFKVHDLNVEAEEAAIEEEEDDNDWEDG